MKMQCFIAAAFAAVSAFAAEDIMIEDFESGFYAPKWTVEGEAFGASPAKGGFSYQNKVSGYNGDFLVNSYFNKDDTTGKITSAPFKIERRYLAALVGGGESRDRLYLRVLADGMEVGRVTGHSDEKLIPRAIDLGGHLGKSAVIEIVDDAKGGWGHINVDDIRLTDKPDAIVAKSVTNIEKAKRYVNIPISYNAPERMVKISDPDNTFVLVNAKIRVDFENPEWFCSLETRGLEGGPLRVEMDSKIDEKTDLETTDKYWADEYPNELLRPQYHFSPVQGWLNDPNGLVHWQGKWHMYYQLSPHSVHSREKSWGYAVSKDLVSWLHQPVGISTVYYPKGGHNAIWSGTAFADINNCSGFFGDGGGLIFAYTLIGRGDYVAYSPDGKNIKSLEGPITNAHGRDPCIFYHEPTGQWITLRYEVVKVGGAAKTDESAPGAKKFVFYHSKDLKNWRRGQVLDDFYECPYMLAMPVNGNSNNVKYLIFDARGECVVGDFDGETFTAIGGRRPKFLFGDAYAGQIFRNAPNGRMVNISWLIQKPEDFGKSGMPFSQMMALPLDLRLVEKSGEYAVHASLVPEIGKLYAKEKRFKGIVGEGFHDLGTFPSSFMLEASLDMTKTENAKIDIGPVSVNYVRADNAYHIVSKPRQERNLKTADLTWQSKSFKMDEPAGGTLNLKIFADRSSLEIFHDDKKLIGLHMPFGDEKLKVGVSGKGLAIKWLLAREIKTAFSEDSLNNLQNCAAKGKK